MRIVLAVARLGIGGAERNVVNYARSLADRGHEVTVLADSGPLASELRGSAVELLTPGAWIRRPWTIIGASRALLAAHGRIPIDVVHSFMASSSLAAAVAARWHHLAGRETFALVAAAPGFKQNPSEPAWVTKARLRLLVLGAQILLVPSAEFTREIERIGIHGPIVRQLDFNVVDLERFDAELSRSLNVELRIPSTAPVVLSLARLHPLKGQDQLLRAAPLVLRRVPDTRFVFVGSGPWRTDLERLALRLGVRHATVFTGERTDVPALLARSHLLVQTTVGGGGPGLAVLEAFAARRPVVGPAFPELSEAIGDSGAASLVPHADPAALADAIARLLEEPARATAMGQQGRARVEARFSLSGLAWRLEEVYAEAVGRTRRETNAPRPGS